MQIAICSKDGYNTYRELIQMTRQEAIENLTLALLYLTRFGDGTGQPFNEIAWKNYDFDAIDALDSKDLVVDPRTSRGHAKYVYLTENGRKSARDSYHPV